MEYFGIFPFSPPSKRRISIPATISVDINQRTASVTGFYCWFGSITHLWLAYYLPDRNSFLNALVSMPASPMKVIFSSFAGPPVFWRCQSFRPLSSMLSLRDTNVESLPPLNFWVNPTQNIFFTVKINYYILKIWRYFDSKIQVSRSLFFFYHEMSSIGFCVGSCRSWGLSDPASGLRTGLQLRMEVTMNSI